MKSVFTRTNFKTFVKFGCVGVINTVIDTAVFFLLCDFAGLGEIFSNTSAYIASATNSYFMNSGFVWHDRYFSFEKYLRFLTGNVLVLIISGITVKVFAGLFEVKTIAKLVSMPITVILNFSVQRFVIFGKSAEALNEKGEKRA